MVAPLGRITQPCIFDQKVKIRKKFDYMLSNNSSKNFFEYVVISVFWCPVVMSKNGSSFWPTIRVPQWAILVILPSWNIYLSKKHRREKKVGRSFYCMWFYRKRLKKIFSAKGKIFFLKFILASERGIIFILGSINEYFKVCKGHADEHNQYCTSIPLIRKCLKP